LTDYTVNSFLYNLFRAEDSDKAIGTYFESPFGGITTDMLSKAMPEFLKVFGSTSVFGTTWLIKNAP
jgi:hypothetical protein